MFAGSAFIGIRRHGLSLGVRILDEDEFVAPPPASGTSVGTFQIPWGVMVTQVRIYTVNGGMLDSWIKHFNERIVPTSAKYGVRVLGAWANRPQNEFIWVRTFADDAALKAYEDSPERAAYLPINRQHLAKTEVRTVEPALSS